MNRKTAKILILDGHSTAALAVLQSLGAQGHTCWIADSRENYAALHSRYVTGRATYSDPLSNEKAFVEWMISFQRENNFDLIIPVTENSLLPLHRQRNHPTLEKKVALPSAHALEIACNKERSRKLAAALGASTPRTQVIDAGIGKDLDTPNFEFPVFVKAIHSKVWKEGRGTATNAILARNAEEFRGALEKLNGISAVQVQQWVPGIGYGIELLARDGEILMTFAHRRIHESPLTGGASTYREAVEPPAELLELSRRAVSELHWTGVAMFEFRVDALSNKYWFLEINPRFWGSLPLAAFAGADFPAALVNLLLFNEPPARRTCRSHVYARNFARDVNWTQQNLRHWRGGPYLLTRPVGRTVLEWGRVLIGKEVWDGAKLADPAPIFYEVRRTILDEFLKVARFVRRRLRSFRASSSVARQVKKLRKAKSILVLCYGNICRSAFVKERLRQLQLPGVTVQSAGLGASNGQCSPALFQDICRARGVDLSAHRSRRVTQEDLTEADAILIMDSDNFDLLRAMDRNSLKKVVWLGAIAGKDWEVADPLKFSPEATNRVLDQLDAAVSTIAREKNHPLPSLLHRVGTAEQLARQ